MRISDWSSDVCSSDLNFALTAADQRLGDRAVQRNAAFLHVRLVFADDLPGLLGPAVSVGQLDSRAKNDLAVGSDLGRVDHLRAAELGLDFLDASFVEAVLFARGVIFGVFLEVAVLSSEERRVGNECVSTCGSRWSPSN